MRRYPTSLPYGLEYLTPSIIRKTASFSSPSNRKVLQMICRHLISNPDPTVVPVFDFQMGRSHNGIHQYSYDMKALLELHADEKRLVNIAAEVLDKDGEYPSQSAHPDLQIGWHEWPDLMRFLDKWLMLSRHRDIHDGNIMIDEEDNYRLIDLEAFIGTDFYNDWFY